MKPDRVVIGVDNDEAQGGDGRAVRAVHPPGRQPDPVHGHRVGRGHQVRRQRDAGHPDLVHEPDGAASASWSAPTSTTSGSASARTSGSAGRSCIPGPGYGGSLLPQGREGDHPHRATTLGLSLDVLKAVEAGQRGAEAGRARRRRCGTSGTDLSGQDRRHLGPRLQGRDRRHAREPDHPAHRGAARGRRPGAGPRSQGHRLGARHLRRPGHVRRRSLQRRPRRRRPAAS